MTILVADKFEKSGLEGLAALGASVLNEPDLKDETLEARLADSGADVLIVRSTKVTRPMIEGSDLGLIVRAGAGYNTIDVKAASDQDVQVANCPGKNANAVAELTIGLMIALDRRIPDNVQQLREGRWNKKEFGKAQGLMGATLGLIGMGNIGAAVARAGQALGMYVIVFSGHMSDEECAEMGVRKAHSVLQVAEKADVVSVHSALTDATRGLCGAEFFAAMKPGALFLNTSRAEVVDQAALLKAVTEKGIRAGLDVFDGEPSAAEGEYDGELRSNPNVYCTHHIGASTEQAQEAVAAETVRIVRVFGETGQAPNVVN
jgi:D-3-phosphoglycerate dehydrogenase